MFTKILIANRGEIACRIIRSCKKLGIRTVSVYSEADADTPAAKEADEAVCIGASPASQSYANAEVILAAAKQTGAEAIHPGYGFLSENQEFAEKCEREGIVFIGPTVENLRLFSLKHDARALAQKTGVPVLPGSELLEELDAAVEAANSIGYPVMIKAVAGGGGIGMYCVSSQQELEARFEEAVRKGAAFFGKSGVFVEKYVSQARHIEVQIFGNGKGQVIHIGERECSIQRRHQKVLEETPAAGLRDEVRQALWSAAIRLASHVSYRSAGTVEFIYDCSDERFYFLEVNTRLQVEHGVTELVNPGLDLVEWMIRQASPVESDHPDLSLWTNNWMGPQGHAIEVRLYAEDPENGYAPQAGRLDLVVFPKWPYARYDTWVSTGSVVSSFYDPMVAKVLVHGENRTQAAERMLHVLRGSRVDGPPNNLQLLRDVVASENYINAGTKPGLVTTTRFLDDMRSPVHSLSILRPGMFTSVQDFPGRGGYWNIGVPPSGPMDPYSHQLANALVGNDTHDASLEITLQGPELRAHCDTAVALCGANFEFTIDGVTAPLFTSIRVKAGQVISIGSLVAKPGAEETLGARAYLSVVGGFQVPEYLGSRSTFPLGGFGGHQGRVLRLGDVLPLSPTAYTSRSAHLIEGTSVPSPLIPELHRDWVIDVTPGPHAEPDFFTSEDVQMFYSTPWRVHYNSNRLGVRLEGPRPKFARLNGGEGGNHPSNVHDCEYAVGAINFTGDMPVILTVDGPSLGGFVCPATIVLSEFWKVGQLRPHDTVRFRRIDVPFAVSCLALQDSAIRKLTQTATSADVLVDAASLAKPKTFTSSAVGTAGTKAVALELAARDDAPSMQVRLAGDSYVLVEFGDMILDLNLRFRAHAMEMELRRRCVAGMLEFSPGVRSLQLRYNPRIISLDDVLELVKDVESSLPPVDEIRVPTRVFKLPLAFHERWTREAVDKYMKSVRAKAVYLPDNVEFLGKNNGLQAETISEEDPTGMIAAVAKVVTEARYMILGLGDVYLGAPCAVPVDPRHRLVVPKYNPARTYTPEGGVGIGGSYMCIYPMASPGGYQLLGRTLPIWNAFKTTPLFENPWLFRFFDQIQFEIVSEEELETLRAQFLANTYQPKVEDEVFDLKQYNAHIRSIQPEIDAFKATQQAASAEQQKIMDVYEEEFREILKAKAEKDAAHSHAAQHHHHHHHNGLDESFDAKSQVSDPNIIKSPITGNVWQVKVQAGEDAAQSQTVIVLESMKTELSVAVPRVARVAEVFVNVGDVVSSGDALFRLE